MPEFDITKPPPAGSDEVGPWAWNLFELSRKWRDDELGMPDVWRENHTLYRGNHWGSRRGRNDMTVNLFFSNINRTAANITSRNPVAEVVDLDGGGGPLAQVGSARMKKWWKDTRQSAKLRTTSLNSEIYGITWEKSTWNDRNESPNVVVCDPFAIFPYPGYWENIGTDCPAICHAIPAEPSVVRQMFNVPEDEQINVSETYSLLGGEREEVVGVSHYGTTATSESLHGSTVKHVKSVSTGVKGEKALMVEVWVRDYTECADGCPAYPGGIRCITITNDGGLVLADERNPNINWKAEPRNYENNYMFKRLPFYKNNSYNDTTSIFGFSAAEQTALMNIKIDELFSRLVNYAMRAMTGILIIPPKSGISKKHLSNKPNLVLFPQTTEAANNIRFVSLPNPPSSLFNILDMLVSFHDRIYAIQDVDRGETPKSITAASAIVALQERNNVLIQHKIDGVDSLVEERGQFAIAQWQMHGHLQETIEVGDEMVGFKGTDMAGRNFNYIVESGSTIAKTSLQMQEQSMALANAGFIDQQALLDALNYPGANDIIERMSEDKLDQALQILIGAGLPEETAIQLMQTLQQPQGGPGNRAQRPPTGPQPGVPRAMQGNVGGG